MTNDKYGIPAMAIGDQFERPWLSRWAVFKTLYYHRRKRGFRFSTRRWRNSIIVKRMA